MPPLPVLTSESGPASGLPADVLREASQWLAQLQERALTPAEEQAFARWYGASSDHQRAWRYAEQLMRELKLVPPDIASTTLQHRRRLTRRDALKKMLIVGASIPAGLAASGQLPWRRWLAEQHTAVGERRTLPLEDGSILRLNTASAIDLAFDAHQRFVRLIEGEVLVETADDASQRPFFVDSGFGRLQALGTRFVVHKRASDVRLTVLDGRVAVMPGDSAVPRVTIEADQQLVFTATTIGEVSAADPNASAWVDGILYADDTPLPEFIDDLGRYRHGLLQCQPSASDIRVSGAFRLDDPELILATLERTRPITITWRTRYWAVISRRDNG
jgi:transmembrane sensor